MNSFLRKIGLLLLFVLLLPTCSYAWIHSGSCGENVRWELDTDAGLLEIYNNQSGAYSNMSDYSNIPYYNGNVPYYAYAPWYDYRTYIRGVNISGVNNIGKCAFYGCSSLTSITIPESVTSIGSSAFSGCCGLTSITIPESVTSIGSSAFSGCSGLESVVVIPGNPKYDSRDNCNAIIETSTNIFLAGCKKSTIPESVTSICSQAFSGCSGLTSITIPESVTAIGGGAFENCNGLTSIHITDLGSWCNISFEDMSSNPLCYANHLYINNQEIKDIAIPNSVTTIGSYAFSGCSNLTSVVIPKSVTAIGNSAFQGCNSLTSIHITDLKSWCNISFGDASSNPLCYAEHLYMDNQEIKDIAIPNSVTTIGSYAFSGCSSLTSVIIPECVTRIGEYAFYRCSGLTSVIIPESVTSIDEYAFARCSSLASITIPESVTSIGSSAFRYCSSLASITIPESVTSIGSSAFSRCSSLTSVTIPENLTIIGSSTFIYCSSLTSITIPDGVTSIGSEAFRGCIGLTSVTIPKGVASIGNSAFSDCTSLTSVELNSNTITSATYSSSDNLCKIFGSQVKEYTFGDEVKRIGERAFYDSNEVTSIVFGKNIERIQDYAFDGCDKLEEVSVKNPEPPIAFNTAFTNNAYYAVLYVPEGSEAQYKGDNVWGKFARIRTFKDEPEKCVLSIKSAIGGYLEMICNTQTSYTFRIITEKGWQVSSVSFNGVDVTGNITEDSYTTPLLEGDAELSIVFEMDEDEIDMVNEVGSHSQLRVSASASTIFIHNDGDPINSYIYTTDGKMVKSVVASYGKTVIPVQPDNVYVVKVDNRTFKVAL